jgi:CubicO group peptidase (beta-lactamase class C family)
MEQDTIFRLYSMTKPIAAIALMTLYEEGRFHLDDPISKYIPEVAHIRVLRTPDASITDTVPAVREPTIHDLFRHTAGLMHGTEPTKNAVDAAYIQANLFGLDTSLGDMIKKLATIPLRYQPGTTFSYGIGQDVQARLVEILSGMSFEQFLQARIFGPLAMGSSGYWVRDPTQLAAVHWSKAGKLVPCDNTHGCPEPVNFLSEAANINSYTKNNAHKGGSYGLVSTTADYWRFAQMLLNGGELDGQSILSPRTVQYIARDHLGEVSMPGGAGLGWGLGFAVLKDPVKAGFIGSEGSYYWAGGANTMFWIDPKENIVVVAMTQHMAATSVSLPSIYSELSAMIYGALIR